MAIRGRTPKATVIRLIAGNPGKRPLPRNDPMPTGAVERPKTLKGDAGRLWDNIIARCYWLTWADSPKALMWCHLQEQFEGSPKRMQASRIAQLRILASELGLDPASRTRLGANAKPPKDDPTEKYLG